MPARVLVLAVVLLLAAPGFAGAATIGGGNDLSCSISPAGAAECWGTNTLEALGTGGTLQKSFDPLPVSGLGAGVSDISDGAYGGCAVQSGAAKCWGNGQSGQLGNGTTPDTGAKVPVQVSGLDSGVTRISAGPSHTCAIKNGAASCWGGANNGRLGDGDGTGASGGLSTNTPVPVTAAQSGATDIGAGNRHTCVIVTGAVSCTSGLGYGPANTYCPSNYSTPYAFRPQDVCGPPAFEGSPAVRIVGGSDAACALLQNGSVWCWGSNTFGLLGRGSSEGSSADPALVTGLGSGVSDISMKENHACALVTTGTVRCWGYNQNGQLGNGTGRNSSNVPVDVSGLSGVTALGVGYSHSCAVAGGQRYCWGSNNNGMGQLGNEEAGGESFVPVPVIGAKKAPAPTPSPAPGPVAVPVPQIAPPAPRKATFTVATKTQKLDTRRRALLATLKCPTGGAACTVSVPSSVSVTIRGKKYKLKVSGATRLAAGKSLAVRVTLTRGAAARLKGRTATVTVRLSIKAPGGTIARTLKVKIKR